MVKVVALLDGDGTTAAEAVDRLVGTARDAAAAPGSRIRGLVVSRVVRPLIEGDRLAAMVELWLDDEDADLAQPTLDSVVADAAGAGWSVAAAVTEAVVLKEVTGFARPGSPQQIKLAGTAYRRSDFTLEAFFDYWFEQHAPIGGSVPGVGGYVVSRVQGVVSGDLDADAFIEQWYTDDEAYVAAQGSDEAQAAWNDVANYAETTGRFWLMTEDVVVEPPATGPGLLDLRHG